MGVWRAKKRELVNRLFEEQHEISPMKMNFNLPLIMFFSLTMNESVGYPVPFFIVLFLMIDSVELNYSKSKRLFLFKLCSPHFVLSAKKNTLYPVGQFITAQMSTYVRIGIRYLKSVPSPPYKICPPFSMYPSVKFLALSLR